MILEEYESLFPIPPPEKYLYDINPTYKYLKTTGNNKNRCICHATLTIPTILNNGPTRINNSYYSSSELNNIKVQ